MSRFYVQQWIPAALLLACCGALLAVGPAPATAPTTSPATQPRLSPGDLALLKQLESPDWHLRNNATRTLAQRDSADEPTLEAMAARTDSHEAKSRLAEAIAEIESRDKIGATPITLHVKNAAAKDVYAEVFRQEKIPLVTDPPKLLDGPALPKVSIDADRMSFLEVVQHLGLVNGLNVERTGLDAWTLEKSPTATAPGSWSVSGPMMLAAHDLSVQRIISLQTGGGSRRVGFTALVHFEPKLHVISISRPLVVTKAVDDHGNSINTSNERPDPPAMVDATGWPIIYATLQYPANNPGSRIALMRGTCSVLVATQLTRVKVTHVPSAAAVSFSLDGNTVSFVGCKKVDDGYEMTFTAPAMPFDKWEQIENDLESYIDIFAPDGKQIYCTSQTEDVQPTGEHRWRLGFQAVKGATGPAPVPDTFVIDIPLKTKTLELPFEFRDLDFQVFER